MSPRKIFESSGGKQIAPGRNPGGARGRVRPAPFFAKESAAVIGTIHSDDCLARARTLELGAVDALELRVDHFADRPEMLLDFAAKTSFPLIVTVRAPGEGGAQRLSSSRRCALFAQFLPVAAMCDIE